MRLDLEKVKWAVLVLMLLDHTLYFFPELDPLRAVTRVVAPSFFFLVGLTLRREYPAGKYLGRLLPFALLAEPVYQVLFGRPGNVLFSIALGVALVGLVRRGHLWGWGLLGGSLWLDWGPAAPLSIWAVASERSWALPLIFGLQGTLLGSAGGIWGVAVVTLWSALLVWLEGRGRLVRSRRWGPWWIPYAFYPLHLALLALLRPG